MHNRSGKTESQPVDLSKNRMLNQDSGRDVSTIAGQSEQNLNLNLTNQVSFGGGLTLRQQFIANRNRRPSQQSDSSRSHSFGSSESDQEESDKK